MSKKLIIPKGYTLEVTSWENDGDHYNTIRKTVTTIEEVKSWNAMMQLCKSQNSKSGGLGNSYGGFDSKQEQMATDFMKEHYKVLMPDLDEEIEDDWVYMFTDLAGQLLGYSEHYSCRVMESCTITYSPEDIYVEEIIL